ncbi:hypothetical protein LG003_11445 [Photorhabdus kleinii]|uniref:hypothetical protein n=1 Tax=Photorhabdus kleinii TaxID=768034 RepID=UPI0021D4C7B3|nr:hypothetical protein [Photorhabdus kleinii]MCT8343449.1 hypothetical protein [Photorhabdus kleinii]
MEHKYKRKTKQKTSPLQSKNTTNNESSSLELEPNTAPRNKEANHITEETNSNKSTSVNHNKLPADTQLYQIAMLGSHDAGTYAYSREINGTASSLGAVFPFAFKTQNKNLKKQAEAGARYFDIRVARNKNKPDSFSFFHGPSIAAGNAEDDVKELLNHAAKDTNNFYLIKFVFKGEKKENNTTSGKPDSDIFLEKILNGHHANIIKKGDISSDKNLLGKATVDLLSKGKNIGIMVHGYSRTESELYWVYNDQVKPGGWANQANARATTNFLLNRDKELEPQHENKLNVIQTNMPVASIGRGQLTLGVKSYLFRNTTVLAEAVKELRHAGIISADYIGDTRSATSKFLETIEENNRRLIKPGQDHEHLLTTK